MTLEYWNGKESKINSIFFRCLAIIFVKEVKLSNMVNFSFTNSEFLLHVKVNIVNTSMRSNDVFKYYK